MRRFLVHSVLLLLPALAFGATGEKDLVKWRSLAAGEAESRSTSRPVLYFMTADWCGPCHLMKAQVFTDPELAGLINKEFIPIQLVDRSRETGENAPEVDAIFRRFQLRGFPTLVVSRPGGSQGVSAAGWSGKSGTSEFLHVARGRLHDMEKNAKK